MSKPTDKPGEPAFKTRVKDFWTWYVQVAPRFLEIINDKKSPDLEPAVSEKVDELVSDLGWEFGPGKAENEHSFTLTGEGNLHRQLLTQYWLSKAPKLPGWTFYAARQPGSIKGQLMEMDGRKFNPIEFWITPFVNRENEKVDISVWHPLFEIMQERDRWSVLFIFLDVVLGEYGTQLWIGEIKHESKKLANAIPLEELNEFIKRVQAEHEWKNYLPGECFTGYRCNEQHCRFLRGDVITGTTMHPKLINEYMRAEGELEDPLDGTGADYVFVAFDAAILPKGNEAHARGEIEDALDQALKTAASGRVLGGAFGAEHAYLDLLLFDGFASIEIVLCVLREKKLPAGTSINYFAKEKRGYRRVI